MKPDKAVRLIEKAVEFYVHQVYEVAANLFELGYDQEGFSQHAFVKRAELREALEMAKKEMLK